MPLRRLVLNIDVERAVRIINQAFTPIADGVTVDGISNELEIRAVHGE